MMADDPNPQFDETPVATKPKRKGVKRRAFLIGSVLLAGGGAFRPVLGRQRSTRPRQSADGNRQGSQLPQLDEDCA